MDKTEKTNSGFLKNFIFIFKKVVSYNRRLVIVYSALILITSFLPQIDAFITGKLIDTVLASIQSGDDTQTLKIMASLISVIFLLFAMRIIYDYQSYIVQMFSLRWKNFKDRLQFEALLKQPLHVYEDSEFVTLKNIVDYNAWKLENLFFSVLSILGAIITNTFVAIVFFSYNPLILVSAVLSLIFPAVIRLKFGRQIWGIWDLMSEDKVIFGMYYDTFYEIIPSKFVETKVFGYGRYMLEKFLHINQIFVDKLNENEKKRFFVMIVARILEYFCVGFGFWVIFTSTIRGDISVGSLYFLITMYAALRNGTSFTLEQVTNVMADAPFINSLYKYLTFEPKYKLSAGDRIIESKVPSIEFKNVWFTYPGTKKPILKGINLKIDEKTDVAFVGKNGAGKTTLIKLILRIYDPTKGDIFINGTNIKELSLKEYYEQIGILSQDFNKFRFTVAENIYIGDISKVDTPSLNKDIINAAKKAQVDEFINEYENKYDTYLTREISDGVVPSGGQMQRIAIARAFFKNPNLIILDEPTSAIDSLAEEQIFANIKNESKEKTVIIISHRFATVKKADYIYVVDEGIIKEQGTHESLILNDGLYSQMYKAQQG